MTNHWLLKTRLYGLAVMQVTARGELKKSTARRFDLSSRRKSLQQGASDADGKIRARRIAEIWRLQDERTRTSNQPAVRCVKLWFMSLFSS